MSLPFGLSTLLRPLSPSIARTRLKSNLFALVLFTLISRGWFPPYSTTRNGLVKLGDVWIQGRRGSREGSWTDSVIYLIETVILVILSWNSLEAFIAVKYPTSTPSSTLADNNNKSSSGGLIMTPSRISSPLTRAYSPSPSKPQTHSQQPLSQSLYRPSPSTQTPTRNAITTSTNKPSPSPLSSSTAKIFNLPSTPSASPVKSTGLFFDQSQTNHSASGASASANGSGSTTADGFVLVDREDKEWIDNVRKGVRGKGARGL